MKKTLYEKRIMFDFTLYGHLMIDSIFDDVQETMDLGGINNSLRAFQKLDSDLKIGLVPLSIGHASIFIERIQNDRSSIANLNEVILKPVVKESSVHHIMYINELNDLNFLPDLQGYITADVCNGTKIKNSNLLNFLNYVFVSDEDNQDIDFLVNNVKNGVIHHSKTGSKIITKTETKEFIVQEKDIVKNANVLGAGDIFAASVLYYHYKLGKPIQKAVELAHKNTSKMIRKNNEKV